MKRIKALSAVSLFALLIQTASAIQTTNISLVADGTPAQDRIELPTIGLDFVVGDTNITSSLTAYPYYMQTELLDGIKYYTYYANDFDGDFDYALAVNDITELNVPVWYTYLNADGVYDVGVVELYVTSAATLRANLIDLWNSYPSVLSVDGKVQLLMPQLRQQGVSLYTMQTVFPELAVWFSQLYAAYPISLLFTAPAVTTPTAVPTQAPVPTSSCSPAPTSSLVVNVTTKGATGDGSTDDTVAFNAAIASVTGTGGIVYVPDGTYMINAVNNGVHLGNNMTLQLSANAVLKAIPNGATNYSVVSALQVSNVFVTGGSIVGERSQHTSTAGEWGIGVNIQSSSNVTISNLSTSENWGDGVYIGSVDNISTSSNVTICGVISNHNRRQGMSIVAANGVVVSNSTFSNTIGTAPQAGIDIEPDTGTSVNNVLITKSIISNNAGNGILLLDTNGPVTNIVVDSNTIKSNSSNGITVMAKTGNTIINNTITNQLQGDGIDLTGPVGAVATGNISSGNAGVGIAEANCNGVQNTITSNVLTGNAGGALYNYACNSIITSNTL